MRLTSSSSILAMLSVCVVMIGGTLSIETLGSTPTEILPGGHNPQIFASRLNEGTNPKFSEKCIKCAKISCGLASDPDCTLEWVYNQDVGSVSFQITTKAPNEQTWLAVGFNTMKLMIGTNAAVILFNSSNEVAIYNGYLKYYNSPLIEDTPVSNVQYRVVDGVASIAFDRTLSIENSSISTERFDFSDCHFVVVTSGKMFNHKVLKHDDTPVYSDKCYNIATRVDTRNILKEKFFQDENHVEVNVAPEIETTTPTVTETVTNVEVSASKSTDLLESVLKLNSIVQPLDSNSTIGFRPIALSDTDLDNLFSKNQDSVLFPSHSSPTTENTAAPSSTLNEESRPKSLIDTIFSSTQKNEIAKQETSQDAAEQPSELLTSTTASIVIEDFANDQNVIQEPEMPTEPNPLDSTNPIDILNLLFSTTTSTPASEAKKEDDKSGFVTIVYQNVKFQTATVTAPNLFEIMVNAATKTPDHTTTEATKTQTETTTTTTTRPETTTVETTEQILRTEDIAQSSTTLKAEISELMSLAKTHEENHESNHSLSLDAETSPPNVTEGSDVEKIQLISSYNEPTDSTESNESTTSYSNSNAPNRVSTIHDININLKLNMNYTDDYGLANSSAYRMLRNLINSYLKSSLEAFDLHDYEEIEVIHFSPYNKLKLIANETSQPQASFVSASVLLRYNSKNASDEESLHKSVHEALKHGALPIDANSIEISNFVPNQTVLKHFKNSRPNQFESSVHFIDDSSYISLITIVVPFLLGMLMVVAIVVCLLVFYYWYRKRNSYDLSDLNELKLPSAGVIRV